MHLIQHPQTNGGPRRNFLFRVSAVCIAALLFATPACVAQETAINNTVEPLRAPVTLISKDGALIDTLYTQFAMASVTGATDDDGNPIDTIWTRAYGMEPITADTIPFLDIPGPTMVYHPGDWLQINIHNQMNDSIDPQLESLDDHVPPHSQDDIDRLIPHEMNIPHNADNTNLHVHGMHVDPKQDNVTLLILPEDDNPSNYSPELQRLIPDINRWWEWRYGYRLPADHLPGTHWYHAHKHGATSTHVENGMAGSLVVRPNNDSLDVVPGLWDSGHDRVLMLQEIANFGIQQGDGISVASQASATDRLTTEWPDITINGQHQPYLDVAPGQTERWRFITAGANHRTASYLWVGGLTPPSSITAAMRDSLEAITDFETAEPYLTIGGNGGVCPFPETFDVAIEPFPGQVMLVALDGITLSSAVDIAYDQPILVGPGNRADLIIQPNADVSGTYYAAKNYNVAPPLYELAAQPDYGDLFQGDAGYWRYLALTTCVGGSNVVNTPPSSGSASPFTVDNLASDPYALGTTQSGFQVAWPSSVSVDGDTTGAIGTTNLAPLLRGAPDGAGVKVEPISGDAFTFPGVGWAPSGGGGAVDAQVLFSINVTGTPVTNGPAVPTDAWLSRISPTTSDPQNTLLTAIGANGEPVTGIPAYASPIPDSAISGRQVIVFDKSGIKFNYDNGTSTPTGFNQFILNGRQFDLNDFVGNPHAELLIADPVPPAVDDAYFADSLIGTNSFNAAGKYTNQVTIGGHSMAFYTNPGTYLPVISAGASGSSYYTYDYPAATAPPTYQQITGLDGPRQPEATTAEEWLLVNNSGIFHPFHIHISPLFLTEVGQLNYDGSSWAIDTLQTDAPLGYMLNNWWDVVVIPPYGYVKFRTWFNIPDQQPIDKKDPNSRAEVTENANVYGSWVYHCHILRHEDRGMMMVVNVKPKPQSASSGQASSGHGH